MKLKDQMFGLVEQWHKSNLKKGVFLKGHGISVHKFDYWQSKYNEEFPSKNTSNDFKEVDFSLNPISISQTKILELTTISGVTIKVYEKC